MMCRLVELPFLELEAYVKESQCGEED